MAPAIARAASLQNPHLESDTQEAGRAPCRINLQPTTEVDVLKTHYAVIQGYLFPSFTESSTRVAMSVFIIGVFVCCVPGC